MIKNTVFLLFFVVFSTFGQTKSIYNAYELFYHPKSYTSYNEIIELINDISLEEMNKYIRELLSHESILTVLRP